MNSIELRSAANVCWVVACVGPGAEDEKDTRGTAGTGADVDGVGAETDVVEAAVGTVSALDALKWFELGALKSPTPGLFFA